MTTKSRRAVACPRDPIGLSLDEAAAYVGFGIPSFQTAMTEGKMPAPYQFHRRLIWDADELLAAFRKLPRKVLDLKPGVLPMHDDGLAGDSDEWTPKA